MERLCLALWLAYLCLAPVYWLPYLSAPVFTLFKTSLIGMATVLTIGLAFTRGGLSFSMKTCGLGGFFMLFLVIVPGAILGQFDSTLKIMINMCYATATFVCFHVLFQVSSRSMNIFALSSLFIGLLSLYTALAWQGLVHDFTAPTAFNRTQCSISGFTGLRTGWSNGIAMYVPMAIFLVVASQSRWLKLAGAFAVVFIFLSQVAVAGRAGMLSTLFACTFLIIVYAKLKLKIVLSALVLFAITIYLPSLMEHLRLDRIEGGVDQETLNSFSAGRIGSYMYALEIIGDNPFAGVGFGNTDIAGHSVHNMLLRFTAETGLMFLVVFLAIVIGAITQYRRMKKFKGGIVLIVIIIQGVLESMFEPSMIIAAFQNSTVWWASLGMIAALPYWEVQRAKLRKQVLRQQTMVANSA